MNSIRNIYCVGRNYRLHAEELGNAVPTSPMLFLKPTHAAVAAAGQAIQLPGDRGEVHYELELVVLLDKTFEPGMKVDEAVSQMALGIDFTLRDVQTELKKKGQPWLPAKGFKNSAVLTGFYPFPGTSELSKQDFVLLKNGEQAQRGNTSNMIFDLQSILDFTSGQYGLGAGDIIYTGTPEGVGPVTDGDRLTFQFGGQTFGECIIRLS